MTSMRAATGPGYDVLAKLLEESLQLLGFDDHEARSRIEQALALVTACQAPECHRLLADWQVRRAKEMIEERVGERIRIGDVARAVNLSASYFSRAFSATVGTPYSDYVADRRIVLAKRLMADTDLPLAQIALQCGLSDHAHLSRNFAKSVGVTPHAWRRRIRSDRACRGDCQTNIE